MEGTKPNVSSSSRQDMQIDSDESAKAILKSYDEILKDYPPGYRFKPTDEELVFLYLHNKVSGMELPPHKILDINLYNYNPSDLAAIHPISEDRKWYFFTPRERKYPNGTRPKRNAGNGYWQATGKLKEIKGMVEVATGEMVELEGYMRRLVFYKGKVHPGEKTNWIMKEYSLSRDGSHQRQDENDMKLDSWVLCKLYERAGSCSRSGEEMPNEQNASEMVVADKMPADGSSFGPMSHTEAVEHTLPPPPCPLMQQTQSRGYMSEVKNLAPIEFQLQIPPRPPIPPNEFRDYMSEAVTNESTEFESQLIPSMSEVQSGASTSHTAGT